MTDYVDVPGVGAVPTKLPSLPLAQPQDTPGVVTTPGVGTVTTELPKPPPIPSGPASETPGVAEAVGVGTIPTEIPSASMPAVLRRQVDESGTATVPGVGEITTVPPKPTVYETLRAGGYTDDVASAYVDSQRQILQKGGYTEDEINKYLGRPTPVPHWILKRLYDNIEGQTLGDKLRFLEHAVDPFPNFKDDLNRSSTAYSAQIQQGIADLIEGRSASGVLNTAFGALGVSILAPFDALVTAPVTRLATNITGDPVAGEKAGLIASGVFGVPEGRLAAELAAASRLARGEPLVKAGPAGDVVVGTIPRDRDFYDAATVIAGKPDPLVRQKLVRLYEDHGWHPAEVATDPDPAVKAALLHPDSPRVETVVSPAGEKRTVTTPAVTVLPEKYTRPQPDLFGNVPDEQGSFRFMDDKIQLPPSVPDKFVVSDRGLYRGADGRMHSLPKETAPTETSPTGLFRDKQGRFRVSTEVMQQRELPLDTPEHQTSLDFDTKPPGGSDAQASFEFVPPEVKPGEPPGKPPAEPPTDEPTVRGPDYSLKIPQQVKSSPVRAWLSAVYRHFVDKDSPFAKLGEDVIATTRSRFGLHGMAESTLDGEGPPIYNDPARRAGPSLRTILEPVGNRLDEFDHYLEAQKTLSLDAKRLSQEGGMPVEEARQVVASADPAIVEAEKQFRQFNKNVLDYARDSGVFSKRTYERRLVTLGLKTRDDVVKDTFLYLTLGKRNEARQAVYNAALDLGHGWKPEDTPFKRLAKETGNSVQELRDIAKAVNKDDPPNRIYAWFDGKRHALEVRDPQLVKAMRMMDSQTLNMLQRIAAAPARGLRAGSTLNPPYLIKNLTRDFLDAFVNTKGAVFHPLNTLRGALDIVKGNDYVEAWKIGGGSNATLVSLDKRYLRENMYNPGGLTALTRPVQNVIRHPIEHLRLLSELFENATRLGEFHKLVDKAGGLEGLNKLDLTRAAYASREVTVDFARIGASMQAANSIVAFLNATIQGTDRLIRAWRDNPVGTFWRIAVGVQLPSLYLWWANHNDPRWKSIPLSIRDTHWVVLTKDNVYLYNKPFETGVLFGSGLERFLDWAFDNDPRAFDKLGDSIVAALAPSFLPTIYQGIEDQRTNTSALSGHPIIPRYLQDVAPEEQYTARTTELAKWVGRHVAELPGVRETSLGQGWLGPLARATTSPLLLENYIRDYTGGLGTGVLQGMDKVLRSVGVLPDPPRPTPTMADMPFFGSFVMNYPSAQAREIQDFYDEWGRRNELFKTWAAAVRSGDMEAEARIRRAGGSAMFARLDGVQKSLNGLSKMVRQISVMPGMTPDEKRGLIDKLYFSMIEYARAGNEAMREMQ